MSRIVDIEPLLHKYDRMNEGTEFSPIHFINDLMALEQQPSEDCISRQAVIRLVEQYPNIIGNRCSGLIADIKHLPSVTPRTNLAETSQDCISREALLREIGEEPESWTDSDREIQAVNDYRWFVKAVKSMPSVTPQPKTSYISIDVNKLAKEVAEKALDEITYEGKTIREWAEILVKQRPYKEDKG